MSAAEVSEEEQAEVELREEEEVQLEVQWNNGKSATKRRKAA